MYVETDYYECLECKWYGGEWQSHEQLLDHQTQEEFPPGTAFRGFLDGLTIK
jgi:hypothetical protein